MTWARFDDDFPEHRKVTRLSDAAFRMHVTAICWSNRHLTDGFLPEAELADIAPRARRRLRLAEELQAAGLWDRVDDGWNVHDFLEYQPTSNKVKAQREYAKKRQQGWRDRKKAAGQGSDETSDNAERNALRDASVTPAPSRTRTRTRPQVGTGTYETHGPHVQGSSAQPRESPPRYAHHSDALALDEVRRRRPDWSIEALRQALDRRRREGESQLDSRRWLVELAETRDAVLPDAGAA